MANQKIELTPKEKAIQAQNTAAKAMESFFNALAEADMSDVWLRNAPLLTSAKFFTVTHSEDGFRVIPNEI